MKISYKRLWELLIDKDSKKDLMVFAGIRSSLSTKLVKNGNVNTAILQKYETYFNVMSAVSWR